MKRTRHLMLLAAAIALAACSSTAPVAPIAEPTGDDRFLVDPRTGFDALPPPQFDAAWRFAVGGNESEARRRIADIRLKHPDYLPALLAEAALEIRTGNLDAAAIEVASARAKSPEWIVPRLYEAEIAMRRNDTRAAYDLYRDLVGKPGVPQFATERLNTLQGKLFTELFNASMSASDAEAARLLREALTYNAGATDARILLASKLVGLRQFEEARRELDPVLNTGDVDRPAVQEVLAEIDVGRGRYEEAIVRYERLARRMKEARYNERLEVIKQEWSMSNMPPEFRQALETSAITRADLAVLLYWTVPSVRFARNLGSPPIAIDIENVAGREEIIRAIAIGLYDVDPVTRRVNPGRTVTAARLSVLLSRLLAVRGAPCARGIAQDRVLATCGVTDPAVTVPADATITGREAARVLEQMAKALK